MEAISSLKHNALVFGNAPESDQAGGDIKQFIYRTKSRLSNRALYTVRGETVYILCIRRPGQNLLSRREARDLTSDLD